MAQESIEVQFSVDSDGMSKGADHTSAALGEGRQMTGVEALRYFLDRGRDDMRSQAWAGDYTDAEETELLGAYTRASDLVTALERAQLVR